MLGKHFNGSLEILAGVENCTLAVGLHRGLAVVVSVLSEWRLSDRVNDFDSALSRRCVLGHYLQFKF